MWWSHDPRLYGLTIETVVDGEAVDRVDTCFGMRKVVAVNGKTLLNNHALYQKLILYQGCWPDGLLIVPPVTTPCERTRKPSSSASRPSPGSSSACPALWAAAAPS